MGSDIKSCCENFWRTILFIFNFVFVVTGLALIGLGAYVQVQATKYLDFLGNQYTNTPVLFIVVGVVIFLIAFLGCCGAVKKNKCMVYTYSALLFIVLVAEIAAGIAAYVLKDALEARINQKMQMGMQNYGKDDYGGVTTTWDLVQRELECCGVNNATDWKSTDYNKTPDSCCQTDSIGCGENATPDQLWSKGCLPMMKNQFLANIDKIGGSALGIAVIQLIGVIIAFCIGKSMKESVETV
jgi:CD63 antigen